MRSKKQAVNIFRRTHLTTSKILLQFLSQFCMIDRLEEASEAHKQKCSNYINPKIEQRSCEKKSRASWPWLVAFFYVYTNIRILVSSYLQFHYDFNYTRVLQLSNLTGPEYLKVNKLERGNDSLAYFEVQMKLSKERLKWWGAPFSKAHLMYECGVYMVVSITFASYAMYQVLVFFKFLKPFDLYFMRLMLNEEAEVEQCKKMIEDVVARMKSSSRNFLLNWKDQINRTITQMQQKAMLKSKQCQQHHAKNYHYHHHNAHLMSVTELTTVLDLRELSPDSILSYQIKMHAYLVQEANLMMQQGELVPINRSPEWVDEMSLKFVTIAIGNIFYSIIFDVFVLYEYPKRVGILEITGIPDILMLAEIIIMFTISVLSTDFYLAVLNAHYPDQLKYLDKLYSRLRGCIEQNDRIFTERTREKRVAPRSGGGPQMIARRRVVDFELAKTLNKDLMRVLLEYEIYVKQFAPTQRWFSLILTASSMMLFSIFVFFRLHMCYLTSTAYSLGIYFSIIAILMTDTIIIPICQIHNSSKKLYKVMSSLLAQSVELNRIDESNEFGIYSAHLIWFQRNMIEDSDKFMGNFAACAYSESFQMTWPRLVKIHYFYSLVLLSAFFDVKSWKSLIGDRLDDPFGLYLK